VPVRTRVRFPASPLLSDISGEILSASVLIAILAIIVIYLLMLAQKERRKSRSSKNRIKNRAWRRNE
jgi:predicted LPLAT superfamily acyltransferase